MPNELVATFGLFKVGVFQFVVTRSAKRTEVEEERKAWKNLVTV